MIRPAASGAADHGMLSRLSLKWQNVPMRLAWFSPMPPVPTGVAACSAEVVAALRAAHDIDVFVDEPVAHACATAEEGSALAAGASAKAAGASAKAAHDFVWLHRRAPYDLVVYQLGNSSHHDYEWPYVFRYPGLAVLHDAHLHHARAAALLRTKRAADYRAEFKANHPDASADLAELAIAGFDTHLHYYWPMTRLVVGVSRLTAVHAAASAAGLADENPSAAIETIRLGHGVEVGDDEARAARARVRASYGIGEDRLVFGVFGGLAPEKRLPQVLEAFAAVLPYAPAAHLLLAGAPAAHYDVKADIARRGLDARVTLTGYLDTDEALTAAIAASDVALNLRWPTAREVSGPWLRSLAAGKPTVIIDLAHLADVPSVDPRTWRPNMSGHEPVTVAVDIMDEDHSLRLAMRRLATDAALRGSLGRAGREYWRREHSPAMMLEDYRRVIGRAASLPAPAVTLPPHLRNRGDGTLRAILDEMGCSSACEL